MPFNIESKFRIKDVGFFIKKSYEHPLFHGKNVSVIRQEDTFYKPNDPNSTRCFKLRKNELDSEAEFIVYDRPTKKGAKTSDFSIETVKNYKTMKSHLSQIAVELAVMKKVRSKFRFLYGFSTDKSRQYVQPVYVHIDVVEGLGDFIEFECTYAESLPKNIFEGNPKEAATDRLSQLIKYYDLKKEDEVEGSYVDLFLRERSSEEKTTGEEIEQQHQQLPKEIDPEDVAVLKQLEKKDHHVVGVSDNIFSTEKKKKKKKKKKKNAHVY